MEYLGRTCNFPAERGRKQVYNELIHFWRNTLAQPQHSVLEIFSADFFFLKKRILMKWSACVVVRGWFLEPSLSQAPLNSIVWSGSVTFCSLKIKKRDINNRINELEPLHLIKLRCYIWPDTLSRCLHFAVLSAHLNSAVSLEVSRADSSAEFLQPGNKVLLQKGVSVCVAGWKEVGWRAQVPLWVWSDLLLLCVL